MHLTTALSLLHARPTPLRSFTPLLSAVSSPVTWVNPLDYDKFIEPNGGWDPSRAGDASTPLLVFIPGMDGSCVTPFMQYPELATQYELSCLRHTDGLDSRATFAELTAACTEHITAAVGRGRRVLIVGESFGGSLALSTARQLQEGGVGADSVSLVLVNPATSMPRSALHTIGPAAAALPGPLYFLGLIALAALVLTPTTQAPPFISMIAAQRLPALLCSPQREAYLGRVALCAFLKVSEKGPLGDPGESAIADVLDVPIFSQEQLAFRLSAWLETGASEVNAWLDGAEGALKLPTLAVVGSCDRLLPSVDEAKRLEARAGGAWRGTVVVPGAGHASTLGNRIDLLAEVRRAFGDEALGLCADVTSPVHGFEGEGGTGWARGLVDRQTTYTSPVVDPKDYGRYCRGGDRCGVASTKTSGSRSGAVAMMAGGDDNEDELVVRPPAGLGLPKEEAPPSLSPPLSPMQAMVEAAGAQAEAAEAVGEAWDDISAMEAALAEQMGVDIDELEDLLDGGLEEQMERLDDEPPASAGSDDEDEIVVRPPAGLGLPKEEAPPLSPPLSPMQAMVEAAGAQAEAAEAVGEAWDDISAMEAELAESLGVDVDELEDLLDDGLDIEGQMERLDQEPPAYDIL